MPTSTRNKSSKTGKSVAPHKPKAKPVQEPQNLVEKQPTPAETIEKMLSAFGKHSPEDQINILGEFISQVKSGMLEQRINADHAYSRWSNNVSNLMQTIESALNNKNVGKG